jgi:hypothetical protein
MMRTRSIGCTVTGIVTLFQLGVIEVQAQTVILDENNSHNALGIENLSVGGELYNVEFVWIDARTLYGPPPGTFDFPTLAAVVEAVDAVAAVLNSVGGIVSVAPEELEIFEVGFNFSEPLKIPTSNNRIARFRFPPGEWFQAPEPNFPVWGSNALYADFTLASELGCTLDDDCDDDLFCNGGETCFEEQCQDGIPPCIEGEICLEDTDECKADADDDGVDDGKDVCPTSPAPGGVDGDGRPLGDVDTDCDVDLQDYAIIQANMSGPG